MVLKRIIEFEKSLEDRTHVQASGSCSNIRPPMISVSLDNNGREELGINFCARPRFLSENKIFPKTANLLQNNGRSQSFTEEFRDGNTQNSISISCRDMLNDAFRRSINSNCSYLSNRLDSVSSDGSVFSELTDVSPIPLHPLKKLNRDKLCSQSSLPSSSSKNIPLQSVNKSNQIEYFYEIKDETSKIKSHDQKVQELIKSVKGVKLIVKDSNNKFADAESGFKISENESSIYDSIAPKASRITLSAREEDAFSTSQFNFENLLDDESIDFLPISPVPKINLTSSSTDLNDNNHGNNNVLIGGQ